MKWTKEQYEAINTVGLNITVSASAGAGKTAVLVERLIKRIIDDKVSVDNIVALTFTEAAAAEMKNRLMSELSKKYTENPNDTYLQNQITLLPSAKISTIHSFCLSILKDYYYMLQIEPQSLNNILDDATITKVKEEAFAYVIDNFDQTRLEETLYNLSTSAMNIDSLKNMILDLSDQAFSQPNPDQWLNDSIKIYDNFKELNDLPNNFKSLFWDYIKFSTKQLKEVSYQLDRLIDSLKDLVNVDNQKAWMSEVIGYFNNIDLAIKNQDYKEYRLYIENIASIKHKNITKQPDFQELRDQYFKILNEILQILYPEEELLKDLAKNKSLARNIIDIVKMYNQKYQLLIVKENGITFNDMEILTYQLLEKNNQEVAKILRLQIEDILVDEFQDTNILQNQIIELIGRGNNIFRVGDVKQSIYRFRGAKPSLMQNLIQQGNTNDHKTIFLSNNFRSKSSIVNYNNHLFDKLMNTDYFESTYTDADFVTTGLDSQEKNNMPVSLHLVNTNLEDYKDLDGDYNLTSHQFRAEYIANKIVNLYKNDSEQRYNKYTVLVESHKNKEYLRQAFDKANIPYFIAMPDGFYKSYGVSTILAYLKLILDPTDKISLMAILINLYGYTDNEITSLYLIYKDLFQVSDALNKDILKQVNYFSNNQNTLLVSDIINFALSINDFYESKISKQSRTNLDLFYESAILYEKNNTGLYGFILEVELMQKEKTSEASSISNEDNVVNVMTIHNSKGLQFDTVFLYSKSENRYMDSTSNFVIHPELGLALKTVYTPQRIVKDNLANFLIRHYDYKEDLEEEMRKLYVAMTRAQNSLYIVDVFKQDKEKEYMSFSYQNILSSIGYTGWIDAIAQNHPNKNLTVQKQEYFEYNSLPALEDVRHSIIKGQKLKDKKSQIAYQWPIQPLDLSVEEKHFEVGSIVHDVIEKLPKNNWNKEMIRNTNNNIPNYYINKLLKLNDDNLFKKISQFDVYKEHPFISNLNNEFEKGIIDYLAISKQSIYIVDFKTDNVESEDLLITRYKNQLNFYKEAMHNYYPDKEIFAYIYSFYLEKFIEI